MTATIEEGKKVVVLENGIHDLEELQRRLGVKGLIVTRVITGYSFTSLSLANGRPFLMGPDSDYGVVSFSARAAKGRNLQTIRHGR